MEKIIDQYRNSVVQIGTPYSVGTGFYLHSAHLIITNEHVVRDNKEVTLDGPDFERCTARVLYLDPYHDIAFISANESLARQPNPIRLAETPPQQGMAVIALGHPFGYAYSATQGIISNTHHLEHNIAYIQHDAALNPGNSGGPLINGNGEIIGINNFIMRDGNSMGFSLPIIHLKEALAAFAEQEGNAVAVRCMSCSRIIFEEEVRGQYCGHCGSRVDLPSRAPDYEPSGISLTIERFINVLGYDVRLCRMGHAHWIIQEGSAQVKLYYNEKNGMIFGDAYLCHLPKDNIADIYKYLLEQNYKLEGLCLSVPENSRDIVLSLFIYDRYLNEQTGRDLFFRLFHKADELDNILVREYQAIPKTGWVEN